jgi:hypothetical protein
VSAGVLQARDPIGLCGQPGEPACTGATSADTSGGRAHAPNPVAEREAMLAAQRDFDHEQGRVMARTLHALEILVSVPPAEMGAHRGRYERLVEEGLLVRHEAGCRGMGCYPTYTINPEVLDSHDRMMSTSSAYSDGYAVGGREVRTIMAEARAVERDAHDPVLEFADLAMMILPPMLEASMARGMFRRGTTITSGAGGGGGGGGADLLGQARTMRDAEAARLGPRRPPERVAVVVGAYDESTGRVIVGRSGADATGARCCAERRAFAELGGGDGVRFTEPVRPRPRTGGFPEVPVCDQCETLGRHRFPAGTIFQSDLPPRRP